MPLSSFWDSPLVSVLLQIAYVLATTAVAAAMVWALLWARRKTTGWIAESLQRRGRGLSVKGIEFASPAQLAAISRRIILLATVLLVLLSLYLYVSVFLGVFPGTRDIAQSLLDQITGVALAIGAGIVGFGPDAISIVAICVFTYYLLAAVRWGFRHVEAGHITLEWFYPEWAPLTYQIARFFILAMAFVAIFPHIPGHSSPSFQGVSVFLGVVFTFGASSSVANIIAGVLLTYMRAYSVGDRVRIADTVGDVIERGLLVTRVVTIKNEEISIPNAQILSNHIVNYSSARKHGGLILHTSITIGYAVPWQLIHRLLVEAAGKTSDVLQTPEPFVLQTALSDFYVSYEINAYTDQPQRMAGTYSELHRNIQDAFAAAGVEIMSPHYMALRNGAPTAIPGLKHFDDGSR